MIRGFKDEGGRAVFDGENPKGFPSDILKVARRKLRYLNAATQLEDLKAPPANRLEALKGDRAGQYSIRINDQCRLCFKWTPEGPTETDDAETDHAETDHDKEVAPHASRRSSPRGVSCSSQVVGRRARQQDELAAYAH